MNSIRQVSRRAVVGGYFVCATMLGMGVSVLGPTLPDLLSHTNADLSQGGAILAARTLGTLIGSLLSGRLYDRVPAHHLMAGAAFGFAGALALMPQINHFGTLMAVIVLMGMMQGALAVGLNTLLVWLFQAGVAPYLNGLHFFIGLGAAFAPILAAFTITWLGDPTWAFIGMAGLVLLPAAYFLWLPSPAPPKPDLGTAAAPARSTPWVLVGLVVAFFFLYVGGELSFSGWISSYALQRNLADAAQAAALNSLFWIALTVGRLLVVPITLRVRPRRIIVAALIGILGILMGMMTLVQNPTGLWLSVFILGLCMAPIYPTTLAWAGRQINISGTVSSFFMAGGSLGGMAFPWLIGQLFIPVGPAAVLGVVGAANLASLGLYLLLTRWYPGPTPPQKSAL